MSKAGIQSNRGDGYQTLVAFDWALTVLSDPDYQWLEVDSVMWTVDDVVIGKVDGTKICCQCKKNQTASQAWSLANLADELDKAIELLAKDPSIAVRFYSRSAFGKLGALREYRTNFADETTYLASLGKDHLVTDKALRQRLLKLAPKLSTYECLRRTEFVVSDELERMRTLLHERLRRLVSNPSAAYNALWTRLDCLGMRVDGNQNAAAHHRLTKDDLKGMLAQTGAMLIPSMNIVEIRTSFKSTSAIGRAWCRDIARERISSPVVSALVEAIAARHRSILLTGLPGAGKTCVMLTLQEELEQMALARSDLVPLFIQSREFADMVTAQDRQAQGLSVQWVEEVARTAEDAHAVVVIDSLDVLSIAREHSVLTYFLAQIDRLLLIPNVTIITACRDFDRHYDRRIAQRTWDKVFTCEPLDWDITIEKLLKKLGIDASIMDAPTRELIRNPRELALFVELAQQGGSFNVVTSQALAQRYLQTVVQADNALSEAAMHAIEGIAAEMLKLRSLSVPSQRFAATEDIQRALLSHNVLRKTKDDKLTFGHQTLLDVLVISGALRRGMTLNEFIQDLPPVPFVRPSIRSFVAQLATGDRRTFRKQLRTVLVGNDAFHIRRLVAECWAEQVPHEDDWLLIRDLRCQHRDVFQVIYMQAARVEWHYFWRTHLVPLLKETRDAEGLTAHVHRVSQWKNDDPAGVLALWVDVLTLDWVAQKTIALHLGFFLSDFHENNSILIAPLLRILLSLPRQDHSSLGHALVRCVTAGGVDDAVLWSYVVGEINDEDVLAFHFNKKLHCQPHEFGSSNDKFLTGRMQHSTALLDLAITSIERWSQIKASRYRIERSYSCEFLDETSYGDAHTQIEFRHVDGERVLLDAIEAGIIYQAKKDSSWWKNNRERLCFSAEGALRYFAILACGIAPTDNLFLIGRMLCDQPFLESNLSHELGTLMHATFMQIDPLVQDAIQATVLRLHQEIPSDRQHDEWVLRKQAQLVITIPCHLRSQDAQAVLNECEKIVWPLVRQTSIGMQGGRIGECQGSCRPTHAAF